MLCDRCVLSGKCEFFVPDGECAVEKKAYDWVFSELMDQYDLEGLVDEILVRRVVMYLIRIARAEVYEASVGVSDTSVVWGRYIAGLDKSLRDLLKDLALTRAERKKLEKGDILVDVDRLLKGSVKKSRTARKARVRRRSPTSLLLKDWKAERRRLSFSAKGDQTDEENEDS